MPPFAISTASVAITLPVTVRSPEIVVDGKYTVPSLEDRDSEVTLLAPKLDVTELAISVAEEPDSVMILLIDEEVDEVDKTALDELLLEEVLLPND